MLLRIFKKYKSKKLKNCDNEIIISYFALIYLIQFFSLEKEKYSFHMGLKTRIRNILLRHINEFNRIINWNNLKETFQSYRENYSIVTGKESFFLRMVLFRQYKELIKILTKGCCQKKGLWVCLYTVGKRKLEILRKSMIFTLLSKIVKRF